MGNSMSHKQVHGTGKVILSDGSVHEFNNHDLTVAELMLEHPQQVVVEFRAAVSAKRPIPLPADTKLDKKKIYLMFPMKRGKPLSMSSEDIRGVLSSANSLLRSRSSSLKFLPLFARICPAGDAHAFVLPKKEYSMERTSESEVVRSYLPEFDMEESLDARPEFLTRQLSGKATWKPNLDTIKEKKVEKKLSHWYLMFKW
ncbi:hypothetical protein RchiOBHm_Chr7g0241631 [Rosa chinensis]|uniref:Multidrug resistance protein ABC transporter family protein n=1 Tax=Rosa chinensis TaxID=74649 RepID=A0A2P6PIA1_ROSCH|nr:uncharacterized protein LOC112180825 [Rosa chinensis]PRQ21653.1 hypothetical protein RchiOBHm_Chr7g0241631 [Rosa chinensis]